MEAKDTVMRIEDWEQFDLGARKRTNQLAQDTKGNFNAADIEAIYKAAEIAKLEKQAEISFPLGKQEGRKEAVEWIESNVIKKVGIPIAYFFTEDELQEKLKEWGLE